MHKLFDVFGIRSVPVLSYVARENVDGKFLSAIASDHHIVIYGSSKQGKTSLREKTLPADRQLIYRCGPGTTSLHIYQKILNDAGITIQTSETVETNIKAGGKVGLKAKVKFMFESGGEADASVAHKEAKIREFVDLDLNEAQVVGDLLLETGFRKIIVLENFHYLSDDAQKAMAFDLKTFHELGIRFIVLGVWREANQLVTINGDLRDRIVEIPIEPWTPDDFRRVVKTGEPLLKVEFHKDVVEQFIQNSFGNVGLFQEFLRQYCEILGVQASQSATKKLDKLDKVESAFHAKLEEQRGGFVKSLEEISAKCRIRQGEDPLKLPYYLVQVFLRSMTRDNVENGVTQNVLLKLIRSIHHRKDKETIRSGDVTNLMNRLRTIQKDMNTPLLYFDRGSDKLKVVDTRELFVWTRVDRQEIAEKIPEPRDASEVGCD